MNTVSKISVAKSAIIATKQKKVAKAAATGTRSPQLNKVINSTAAVIGGGAAAAVIGIVGRAAIHDTAFLAGGGLLLGGALAGGSAGDFAQKVLNHAPGEKYKFLGAEIDLDTAYQNAATFLSDPKNAGLTTLAAIAVIGTAVAFAPWTTGFAAASFVGSYALSSLTEDSQPAATP